MEVSQIINTQQSTNPTVSQAVPTSQATPASQVAEVQPVASKQVTHKQYVKNASGDVFWPITSYDSIIGIDDHMDDFLNTVTKSVAKADGQGNIWFKKPDNPAVGDLFYTKDAKGYDVMEKWDGTKWVPIISTGDIHKIQGEVDTQTSSINSLAASAAAISDLANKAVSSAGFATDIANQASSAASGAQTDAASAAADAQSAMADATTAVAQAADAQSSAADAITNSKAAQSDAATAIASANGASSSVDSLKQTVDENTATIDTLATQKSVDTLSGTVTTLSTDVSQNAKDIKSKADSTVVDTINETVTNQGTLIDQNAKEIKLKADSSTVDKLNGSVSALSAQVNTQAGQISLMASKTDIAGMATQSYVQAQTKIVSDSITSTVSSAVNQITAGDRNYILNSAISAPIAGNGGANQGTPISSWGLFSFGAIQNAPFTDGQSLMLSVEYTVTGMPSGTFYPQFGGTPWGFNAKTETIKQSSSTYVCELKWKSAWASTSNAFTAKGIQIRCDNIPVGTTITFNHVSFKASSVNKDWTPAPEDAATVTALTSLSQTVDAVKALATDNKDKYVSLQLTVNGYQSTVTDKITGIQTQQTALANQYTSVVGAIGQKNFIANSEFVNLSDWTFDNAAYWTVGNGLYNSYDGSNVLRFYGLQSTGWTAAHSNPIPVSEGEPISISAIMYATGPSGWAPTKSCTIEVDFFDTIGGPRQEYYGSTNSQLDVTQAYAKQQLKVENIKVPTGRKYVCFTIQMEGPGNVMIAHPQLVKASTAGIYQSSTVSQSQLTQTQSDINLRVKTNDVVNQINISKESILIDGKKIQINGQTQIADGVIKNAMIADAAINSAKIGAVDAGKITTGTLSGINISGVHFIGTDMTLDNALSFRKNGQINATYDVAETYADAVAPRWFTGNMSLGYNALSFSGTLGSVDSGSVRAPVSNYFESYIGGDYFKLREYKTDKTTLTSRVDLTSSRFSMSDRWPSAGDTASYTNAGNFVDIQPGKFQVSGNLQAGSINAGAIWSGNIGLNSAHSIISKDGGDLYITNNNGTAIPIHVKSVAQTSLLSQKTAVQEVDPTDALNTVLATDIRSYQYQDDVGKTDKRYASVIIDDVNKNSQYSTPTMFIDQTHTGRDDGSLVGYLVQAIKALNKKVEDLQNGRTTK